MKTIILTRHAKSDWHNLQLLDIDRPLNPRGLKDATEMGRRLHERRIKLDVLVSSTAKRAAKTTLLIAEAMHYPVDTIVWLDHLYHASPKTIQSVIFDLENTFDTAMIVCHNPGISEFVYQTLGHVIGDMATCAMAGISFQTTRWEDYPMSSTTLSFYDYPKKLEK